MSKVVPALCATVLLGTTVGQANAAYEIIRWNSGYCQIVDQSSPMKSFGNDFKRGRRTFKTYDQANAFKAQLVAKRQCW